MNSAFVQHNFIYADHNMEGAKSSYLKFTIALN